MPYPWTANDILTAADLNAAFANLPVKTSWHAKTSGVDQAGISVITDVTGLSVAWTADASRQYRTTISFNLQKLTTANTAAVYITNAASATIIAKSVTLAINDLIPVHFEWVETGLSGAQTRKVRVETATGTLTVVNSFSRNGIIIVEDIGPV